MNDWEQAYALADGDVTRLPVVWKIPRRIAMMWGAMMINSQEK